jgi:hypothetical protein
MNDRIVLKVPALIVALWICPGARGQAMRPAPQAPLDPAQQALAELGEELKEIWSGGGVTFEQKIDMGRLLEQILSAAAGERTVPMSVVEEKARLLDEIVTPQQREQAHRASELALRRGRRNTLATFTLQWPEDLFDKWNRAFAEYETEFLKELNRRRNLDLQVADEVGRNPALHPAPHPKEDDKVYVDQFTRPAGIERYIRLLDFEPYLGRSFDEKVLGDPDLNDDQRRRLRAAILAKAIEKRGGLSPLTMIFRNLELTPDQLDRFEAAFKETEQEQKKGLAEGTIKFSTERDLATWFREELKRRVKFDELLAPQQKKLFASAERILFAHPGMQFALDEVEPELVFKIEKVLDEFDAQIKDIPRARWGRSMVYQEAKLDRDTEIFRLGMKSQRMTPRRKAQIIKETIDYVFPEFYRIFPPSLENLLNGWPVDFPGDLPRGVTTSESFTPKHWLAFFKILSRPEIWNAAKDAQLTNVARMITAQAQDGKAMDMQKLAQYRINRSLFMFTEAVFADPVFTPLQKLLIFESYWNKVGPQVAYYYALDLDADVFYDRLSEMRRMLVFAASWAPESQLVYSVSDIANRQKASLDSVQRWTEIGGLFSEEEMKKLKARHDELSAMLDEWSKYVPPDPNKPVKTAPVTD